jgi:hypothetical protein
MLTYLEAQLHPEKISLPGPNGWSKAKTLGAAASLSQELRADAGPGLKIAFAWLYDSATGGYSSFAFFNPKEDYAAIVLANTTVSASGSFADLVGQHIGQRLAGKPAVSLSN